MRIRTSLILFICIGVSSLAHAQEQISFNRDVRPILSDHCFHCHGPDSSNQESEFRLNTKEQALADLGDYKAIVPGSLDASELHLRIRSDDDDRMPPPDEVRQLTENEKDILDQWIAQGANFEQHWSFVPVRESIPVPQVGEGWARNDIDRFIFKRLTDRSLQPNKQSSREKWLRRVTFDLTGLPPTLNELDLFVNDETDNAYEIVVERLLNSDAYAERMTSEWLDVARYSDTYGYQTDHTRFVWPWRDWVIRAFKSNLSYDQFITWQVAGDLLPDATQDQKLATAFNRLHSHKKEGGSSEEEFRIESVADRTQTFAAAFMGLTFECARCHDHKYDPIKTREYYELSSFFANIDERGMISFFTNAIPTPALSLPTDEAKQKLAEASDEIQNAEDQLRQLYDQANDGFEEWLNNRKPVENQSNHIAHLSFDEFQTVETNDADKEKSKPNPNLKRIVNLKDEKNPATTNSANQLVPGKRGNAILLTGDDPVNVPVVGHFPREQPFSFALWINSPEITDRAVIYRRSRGWDDAGSIGYELTKEGASLSAKLVHFWPGNAICVETKDFLKRDAWFHVAITYDGSSKASGLKIFVNGEIADTTVVQDHLTRQITKWNGGDADLAIGTRFRDRGFKHGLVDEFHVFDRAISAVEVKQLIDGSSLNDLIAKPLDQLTDDEQKSLFEFYWLSVDERAQTARDQLKTKRQTWNSEIDLTPAIMVMRESVRPRQSYVLIRGAYDNRGDPVSQELPSFLPPLPEDHPRNRLGLARWLTSSEHPLTARVTVNRYWQMLFGQGIVLTPEDFGMQGKPPTHPELLDWLARDFMNNHWNVHDLLRKIVLSATYRQDSVVGSETRNADPENLWLARGPSQRLTAEMIRDNALSVSGLLSPKIGGRPVKPYDLRLSFKPTAVDKGEGLFRRSLYTFWQRTAPAPVMMAMNANKRDVCRLRREATASPLQAFVLLNGPQFVEASRVLAARLLEQNGDDTQQSINDSFRALTSRPPSPQETEILLALFTEQLAYFESEPEQANELLSIGDSPQSKDSDPIRHAATTVLVNAIMNLDESARK